MLKLIAIISLMFIGKFFLFINQGISFKLRAFSCMFIRFKNINFYQGSRDLYEFNSNLIVPVTIVMASDVTVMRNFRSRLFIKDS